MTTIITSIIAALALAWLGHWLWQDTSGSRGGWTYRRYQRFWGWLTLETRLTATGRQRLTHQANCPDAARSGTQCFNPDRTHKPCDYCGTPTGQSEMKVHPDTLRRRRLPICQSCQSIEWAEQRSAREARTKADWERPIPDQYSGPTRELVREFVNSAAPEVIVDDYGPTASSINGSLETLGLGQVAYAELRSGKTVIRRTAAQ